MTCRTSTATPKFPTRSLRRSDLMQVTATTRRILGIDPGSRTTGFGLVRFDRDRPSLEEAGTVRTADGDFNDRLREIHSAVDALVERLQPDIVAVEQVFVSRNAASALKLGAARSAAICATFRHDVVLAEYAPRAIKLAVTGTGAASKEQVQHMIRVLLGVQAPLQADAADALAVAICHGHSVTVNTRLGEALARRRR